MEAPATPATAPPVARGEGPSRGERLIQTRHTEAWPTERPILDDGRRRQPVPGQLLLLRRHYREPTIERMNLSFLRRKRQPLSIPSQPRARRKISVARQRDGVYALPEADFAPETSGTSDISMPIAVTELGDDIVWRPEADLWPHLHLEGLIGSGKTITAQNIAVAAARARWRVHILRQFDREYGEFIGWPGVEVATTPTEHSALLQRSVDLMYPLPAAPLLVVIDTVKGIVDGIGDSCRGPLRRIALDGRVHQAHLVLVADPTAPDPVPEVTELLCRLTVIPPLAASRRPRGDLMRWRPGQPSAG